MLRDPRDYQIGVLAGLLLYGLTRLHFDISPARVALTLSAVLVVQWLCTHLWRLPRLASHFRGAGVLTPQTLPLRGSSQFDPKSALISGLSLCLLLRANDPILVVVAAAIAIASKFLLRIRGKHLFNPTNGAIVALLLTTDAVWVSPGQWGNVMFFGFLMACLGGLVVHRALRSDVAYAFILFYAALLFGRSIYLGEPLAIPLHRLQAGGLLLFTFFMISDPRTTPDSRTGRVIFAALVACGAWYVQFRLFRTNGLLWALAACALLVPVLDRLFPGSRYTWADAARRPSGAAPQTSPSPSPRPAVAITSARVSPTVRGRLVKGLSS